MIERAALLAIIATTAAAATPEPIHHDETAQPTIDMPGPSYLPGAKPYVMGHLETIHEAGRPKAECMALTGGVINDDLIKCRNGYDWKHWVPGHFIDRQ